MQKQPTFSLCHSTARLPGGWQDAYRAWLAACVDPSDVEYIVAIDEKDCDTKWLGFPDGPGFARQTLTINHDRTCAVDGWNAAARASRGRFLITVSDDLDPCPRWDEEIRKVVPDMTKEVMLDVDCGPKTLPEFLYFNLETRVRYERLGYMFWPEYWGMYADNEETEHAKLDGVMVNARHLKFTHRHCNYGTAPEDDVYRWQQRPEAFQVGAQVLARRRDEGFPSLAQTARPLVVGSVSERGAKQLPTVGSPAFNICVVYPGETFNNQWVAAQFQLIAHLLERFRNVWPIMPQVSNVHMVRHFAMEAMKDLPEPPDFVLWIDDDNLLTPAQFNLLFDALRDTPQLSGVAGWCWIYPDGRMSCGMYDEIGNAKSFDYDAVMAAEHDQVIFQWSGFPIFLHRYDLFKKLPKFPFRPMIDDRWAAGMSGEDTAFFHHANQAGCLFAVDRRVKVPHLKVGSPEPDWMMNREMFPKPHTVKHVDPRMQNGKTRIEKVYHSLNEVIWR